MKLNQVGCVEYIKSFLTNYDVCSIQNLASKYVVKQSSSWPKAAAECLCTRKEQRDKGGTVNGRDASKGPATLSEPRIRCRPGKKPCGGKPAPGGATPVQMGHPQSQSMTEDPRQVSFQARNL